MSRRGLAGMVPEEAQGHVPMYLRRRLRWVSLGLLLLVACGGDSCSGGCDGGCSRSYPEDAPAVENGAQIRLSSHGLDYLETQAEPLVLETLGGDGLTFCVPRGSGPDICYARQCPSTGEDGCELSMTIDDVQLEAVSPGQLKASVVIGGLDQQQDFIELDLATAVECILRLGSRDNQGISASLTASFSTDPQTGDVLLDLNPEDIQIDLQSLDLDIDGVNIWDIPACEGLDFVANLDLVQNLVFDNITGPLGEQIAALTSGFLCQQCSTDIDCPQNTDCVDDPNNEGERYCYNPQAERCVAAPLGLEGMVDLGALLAGTIPGIKAQLAYQLKAHGYAQALQDGLSIGMRGGTYADKAECVPAWPAPSNLSVPRSQLLEGNQGPDGRPFHLGLGLSKAFLDEALWGAYNSGVLCLSVGTGLSDLLSTSTFATLLPSLRGLTGGENGPFYLQLAPSQPPTATIGAGTIDPDSGEILDPLLQLEWKDLDVDFYAFFNERYVRVLTIRADLELPLGINPTEEGLNIVLGDLQQAFTNVRIRNGELLTEDESFLQQILPSLINLAVPLLGESLFDPIAVPDFQGFTIDLENTVLEGIENNSMIGLFTNLTRLPPEGSQGAVMPRLDTRIELLDLQLPDAELARPGALGSERVRMAELLKARPVLVARGRAELWGGPLEEGTVEYSYRLNGGVWSSFRAKPEVVLDDPIFLLQGTHVVEIRSRMRGFLRSMDLSPASLEVVVDFEAPQVELLHLPQRDRVQIKANDAVTAPEALRYSLRVAGGAWTAWRPLEELHLPTLASGQSVDLEVKVKDEAGHEALAQGRFALSADAEPALAPQAPSQGDGCACAQPAGSPRGGWGWLAALGAVAAFRLRRRLPWRRLWPVLGVLLVLLVGCEDDKRGVGQTAACGGGCPEGQRCVVDQCEPGCDTALDCGGGLVCVENECRSLDECAEICPQGQGCVEFNGAYSCQQVTCDEEADCADIACAPTRGICGSGGVCVCEAPCVDGCAEGTFCCNTQNTCQALPDPCDGFMCDPGYRPQVTEAPLGNSDTCQPVGGACGCVELDPLWEGSIGRYLSAAQVGDQVVVAAYNERYGDLMVGLLQGDRVDWRFIDGVPASGTVTGNLNGPRGGVSTSGPDVGRFTSLAADAQGRVHLAYRSDEGNSLRYGLGELGPEGITFTLHEVDADGDAGLWASLTLDPQGQPGIAYMAAAAQGATASELRWAQAGSATPTSSADWTVTVIDQMANPAEPPTAPTGLPLGVGLFASVARFSDGSPAVAYYDHVGTDLRYSRWQDGAWTAPVILDGRDQDGNDTGDMGRFASLSVDAQDGAHVAYVDFVGAQLRYIDLAAGSSQVVDDGVRVVPGAVSISRVGDAAHLSINPQGQPQILYQDATEHLLLLARRDDQGAWSVLTVAGAEQPYKASYGFYNVQLPQGERSLLMTFRYNRQVDPPDNGVSVFTF